LVLEAIIKASPLAIIALDPQGRVLVWSDSAERMFGWLKEEVEGQPLPIVPPEDSARYLREHLQGAQSNPEGVETERVHRNGSPVPVRIWTALMSDGTGYLSVLADLSEAKRAE